MQKKMLYELGYRLHDVIVGTRVLRTRDFLLESQSWTEERVQEYQLKKLRKLLNHCFQCVPYYQQLFKSIGIEPEDIVSLDDFRSLPILTKKIVREESENLKAGAYKHERINVGKTGGTTGPPVVVWKDINARSFVWGSYYRWYNWMGIDLGDPVAILWGAPTALKGGYPEKIRRHLSGLVKNTYWIDTFAMNPYSLPGIVRNLERFQPQLIRGYLSGLLQLAEYLNISKQHAIHPKGLSCTTETLYPQQRAFLESTFGCPVYDQYGCGECESIAFECGSHKGLHINTEHVLVEILDYNGNNSCHNVGRIVVTDLDNFAMPFLRYENGDMACLSEEMCTCGVKQPLLKGISGRIADTIVLADGSEVHGVFFTDAMYEVNPEESKKITRFQAYQIAQGIIQLKLESAVGVDESYISRLRQGLCRFFNSCEIVVVNRIENEKTGKFRYVISEVGQASKTSGREANK